MGRVTEGYGILQPRVSVTMASAAGSLFARLYAGHTGVDPYTTAVSDTYQDVFGEGIFTGKGLYDVDAFTAALDGRVPENALLSHDLFEGVYARTALVTDVEVVDDYPASVLAHARRQHRWVRGDWQILRWLFPLVPSPLGAAAQPPARSSRASRSSTTCGAAWSPPATVALLLAAWTILPGSAAAWTAAVLAALAFPVYPLLRRTVAGPPPPPALARVPARGVGGPAHRAWPRSSLQVTFLANQAWETRARDRAHPRPPHRDPAPAAGVGDRRRQRGAGAGPARGGGARSFLAEMVASPVIAVLGLVLAAARAAGGAAGRAADPPPVGRGAVHRLRAQPARAGAAGRARRRRAPVPAPTSPAAPGRYFATFMGAEDHGLPPDNFQEVPEPRIAHRTSPTNIGMGLLATLSAHDLGFIGTDELAAKVDATLTTMEGLERFEGHLLNWYDTRPWPRCCPRYVSTVDSGNLAGALMALAEGLREAGPRRPRARGRRPSRTA